MATATFCAVAAPMTAAPAHAAYHIQTLCDNIDPGVTLYDDVVPLPGGIGELQIHLSATEDSYVKYEDAGGDVFDALIGVDLGPDNPNTILVCARVPFVGNYWIEINLSAVPLPTVKVCQWFTEPADPNPSSNCPVFV